MPGTKGLKTTTTPAYMRVGPKRRKVTVMTCYCASAERRRNIVHLLRAETCISTTTLNFIYRAIEQTSGTTKIYHDYAITQLSKMTINYRFQRFCAHVQNNVKLVSQCFCTVVRKKIKVTVMLPRAKVYAPTC